MSGQRVDLADLNPQQLLQVKKQLDDELENLNLSYNQLRAARQRFVECEHAATSLAPAEILVPMTASLYMPGRIIEADRVIVDVGTGFFVDKNISEARDFYTGKVAELGKSLQELEAVLQGKGSNLRTVEEGEKLTAYVS